MGRLVGNLPPQLRGACVSPCRRDTHTHPDAWGKSAGCGDDVRSPEVLLRPPGRIPVRCRPGSRRPAPCRARSSRTDADSHHLMEEQPTMRGRPTVTCAAKAKTTGERCKRAPIPGGTVCIFHGGGTQQSARGWGTPARRDADPTRNSRRLRNGRRLMRRLSRRGRTSPSSGMWVCWTWRILEICGASPGRWPKVHEFSVQRLALSNKNGRRTKRSGDPTDEEW